MEGLKGVELLMVYALGFAVFLAAIAVWILAFRWMWKQRGIGFAQGWFEVVDRRALIEDAMSHRVPANSKPPVGTGAAPSATAVAPGGGTVPASWRTVGAPRYLVPVEKK
jgi:hypothetical protein